MQFKATLVAAVALIGAGSALYLVARPDQVAAAPAIGAPAPAFAAIDSNGATHNLSDYLGQTVVLEWTNHECPFVVKHYGSGNMRAQQAAAVGSGVVWLSVISSAPGKQGHVTGAEANALTEARGANPTAVLLDPEGVVGQAYGARTTPHMYVIDGEGALRYMGGIDDRPTADPADIAAATAYVPGALAQMAAGEAVDPSATPPYGCTVKY